MCIVIDINTMAAVFNVNSEKHDEFKHVRAWIEKGHGVIVYGGSKFIKELTRASRYLSLILKGTSNN